MLGEANELFMLSVIMLSVIMLSVIMLSVIMLSVIMLSVIMLSVVEPNLKCYVNCSYSLKIKNSGKNFVRECQ